MSRLNPAKLHVRLLPGVDASGPLTSRRYTLTHSDLTGDLFLAIGTDYDHKAISNWYTRLMRDEVLAEWQTTASGTTLQLYCHLSGGLVFGSAGWRYLIFRRELPLVLEAMRYGDAGLYVAHPELDQAPIWVSYRARQRRYQRSERWGKPSDYRLESRSTTNDSI
jgi:hypothetical protein